MPPDKSTLVIWVNEEVTLVFKWNRKCVSSCVDQKRIRKRLNHIHRW